MKLKKENVDHRFIIGQ